MERIDLCAATLALVIVCASYVVEKRAPSPFDDRMRYLIAWIAARSDYSARVPMPRVQFLPHEAINYRYYSKTAAGYHGQRDVHALYDDVWRMITWRSPDWRAPRSVA